MPKLRQPPTKPEEPPVIEDYVAPDGDIEIELTDADPAEIEIALKPAIEPVSPAPAPEPEQTALQKALEAQQRAEELARAASRERDEAVRRAHEREQELYQERGSREDAEYNSVLTSIAAEESALAKAEADYAAFAQAGDWGQAAAAQRIIGTASARLDRLGDNKLTFDSQREIQKTQPPSQQRNPPPPVQGFEQKIGALNIPDNAKDWLRSHPEFINDTSKTDALGAVHNYLTKSKMIANYSPAYFDALDTEFGFKTPPARDPDPPPPQRSRSMPVSAPVSRDIPNPSGQRSSPTKMTLTEEERRIARNSFSAPDMTDAQKEFLYAQNKRKLQVKRANGEYPQPERN